MTIRDLAGKAGVSASTVSRALSNSPLINPETRERIRRLAEESGYRPNLVARSLTRKATRTLGIIAPGMANPFFGELIERVTEQAGRAEYSVLLAPSGAQEASQAESLRSLQERQVDGIILMTGMYGLTAREEIDRCRREGTPVVVSGWVEGADELDLVSCDDSSGGYALTRHLLALGHHRLTLVGPRQARGPFDRIAGFRRAIAEAGLEPPSVRLGALDPERAGRILEEILDSDPRPDVIVAYNDALAALFMRLLDQRGIRVPEEMAVVGFDDLELAGCLTPPLTTVAYPMPRLAEEIVRLLTERLHGPRDARPRQVMLTPRLVVRRSCGAQATPEPSLASSV